jgi:hypothetical protein
MKEQIINKIPLRKLLLLPIIFPLLFLHVYVLHLALNPKTELPYKLYFIDRKINQWNFGRVTQYKTGTVIDFDISGNSEKYTLHGFSKPEKWGTWTHKKSTGLLLRLSEKPKKNLLLTVDAYAYVNKKKPFQIVDVYVNERFLETWKYTKSSKKAKTVIISKALIVYNKNYVYINFKLKDLASPKKLGLGTDRRKLGIGVVSIRLDSIKSAATLN